MKNLNEYITIEEGWTGSEADKAYDKILDAFNNMSQEEILSMIWNYFNADQLQNLYKWMKQDEYFD